MEKFRTFLNECLHNPVSTHARLINGTLIFLIILSIAIIPLHFLPAMEWAEDSLFLAEKIIITIFTAEYLLRIWSANKPLRYIMSWWGIIDLFAILPFYLEIFSAFAHPEIFLILRFLRILKIGRMYELEKNALHNCSRSQHGEFQCIAGEEIERVIQKHPLVFLIGLILPLFFTTIAFCILVFFQAHVIALSFSILFFFFAGIFFIKSWLDYNYDVIYITNKRVILQDRELFGAISNDISYESITNVKPDNTGILHWLMGFGNISIETAAMEGQMNFENAPDPHDVVKHISNNRQKILSEKSISQIAATSVVNHS